MQPHVLTGAKHVFMKDLVEFLRPTWVLQGMQPRCRRHRCKSSSLRFGHSSLGIYGFKTLIRHSVTSSHSNFQSLNELCELPAVGLDGGPVPSPCTKCWDLKQKNFYTCFLFGWWLARVSFSEPAGIGSQLTRGSQLVVKNLWPIVKPGTVDRGRCMNRSGE